MFKMIVYLSFTGTFICYTIKCFIQNWQDHHSGLAINCQQVLQLDQVIFMQS